MTKKYDTTIYYIETYNHGWHEDEDKYDSDLFDNHYCKGKDAFNLAVNYIKDCCDYLEVVSSGRVHPKDVTKDIRKEADNYKAVEKIIKDAFNEYYTDDEDKANRKFTEIMTDEYFSLYRKYLPKAWLKEQTEN